MRDESLARRLSSAALLRSESDLAWSSIADETVKLTGKRWISNKLPSCIRGSQN